MVWFWNVQHLHGTRSQKPAAVQKCCSFLLTPPRFPGRIIPGGGNSSIIEYWGNFTAHSHIFTICNIFSNAYWDSPWLSISETHPDWANLISVKMQYWKCRHLCIRKRMLQIYSLRKGSYKCQICVNEPKSYLKIQYY